MKKSHLRFVNCILVTALVVSTIQGGSGTTLKVEATSITTIQQQINQTKKELETINENIEAKSDELDLLEEQIADLNAEIVNTMTSIGMKEDEIAAKETELADTQVQIEQAQLEYEAAKEREEQQYQAMLTRIRLMYESSNETYLGFFLNGDGMGDMLDRMDYVEAVYEYDDLKLKEFEETKNQVQALWDQLEADKAQLEVDKAQLVTDREALVAQRANLDGMLATKKTQSANYEAEIKKYQQEASVQKKLLQQEQQQLKKLQASQSQSQSAGTSSAANGTYTTTSYTSTIDSASGSDLGKQIAKYACQYIGNPYVSGGTSLTSGADCSGFTYRVYKDFNYSLPRTSYEQRSAGTGVDYSEAQPGDLICYDGHVALYIGGGLIVHASTAKTGIKISNAQYRSILTVRRII